MEDITKIHPALLEEKLIGEKGTIEKQFLKVTTLLSIPIEFIFLIVAASTLSQNLQLVPILIIAFLFPFYTIACIMYLWIWSKEKRHTNLPRFRN